jgi:hypothetical protein
VSDIKRCADYDSVGIMLLSSHDYLKPTYHVHRNGRALFSTRSQYEQAMFAEELYERVKRASRPRGEP